MIVVKLGMIDFNRKNIRHVDFNGKKLNMIVVELGMIDFNGKKLNTMVIDD